MTSDEKRLAVVSADDLARLGLSLPGASPDGEVEDFNPTPLEYQRLIAEGVPEMPYLNHPYIPGGASIWVPGPAGSGKSMWAQWTACRLSRAGIRVLYVSQENNLNVELRRLERLDPNPEYLIVFHYQGVDLVDADHVDWLKREGAGAGLIVLDTFTACWSGDENDNAAVAGFDREVIRPVIEATGASVLTLDHTGHPTAFVSRKGVSAARGASSKGQKADLVLEFRDLGEHRFLVRQGKNRLTGTIEPDRTLEVVDTDDDLLDIVETENPGDAKIRETAEAMVEFIQAAEHAPSTEALRQAMKGIAGKEIQTAAMNLLRLENPRRVVDIWGHIDTEKGRRRAKVWIPAPLGLPDA